MNHRTCTRPDCDKPHIARGLCRRHWKQQHGKPTRYSIVCIICGATHDSSRKDGRFCSLLCRDVWRVDQPDDPMYLKVGRPKAAKVAKQPTRCPLPSSHPVMQLIYKSQRSPLRQTIETHDWDALRSHLTDLAVGVDDCWLWSRQANKNGYGTVKWAGSTQFLVHRLMAAAVLGDAVPAHMPVHHKCAERLCINPDHLQVVTPIENTAEMLERQHYQARIAALEAALASVAPSHHLLTPLRLVKAS